MVVAMEGRSPAAIAGAASERMKVFAEPLVADVPIVAVGLAPVEVETAVPFTCIVAALMFAVLVVFPKAENESAAA